mmetsp:Transcript_76092/g.236312  ORF Transcript_76092/g.236312 Transcript_76092/m.236312 type:complete len:494 (+) Transcript_76092:3-1484(+)
MPGAGCPRHQAPVQRRAQAGLGCPQRLGARGQPPCAAMAESEDSRRALEKVLGGVTVAGVACVVVVAQSLPRHVQVSLAANLALSVLAFAMTTSIIWSLKETFIKANLRGIDLNKSTTRRDSKGDLVRPVEGIPLPESQGTICATVFILTMSVFIPFAFAVHGADAFPHARLSEYLAAVLTITFASFMGFADDVMDLRWRHKIPLPFLATLPVLLVYYANGNETGVMVPNQLRGLLGESLNLGMLFYLFLLLLAVFSTHAINIYAGVNGLEVGQSVVIAASVLILNIVQLHRIPLQYREYRDQHVQSLFLTIPFLSVSLALLRLNWFPSRVFVGDTYCYFAGMTFAVVCIIGHFSKTMVIFLLPQCANFLYSCPQLFSFIGIPCPRHRMPAYDPRQGRVRNSYTCFRPDELRPCGKAAFWLLRSLRLAHVKPADEEGAVQMSNLTLINLVLYALGPCREDVLCLRLLCLQAFCSGLCFATRFGLASYVYDVVL